MGDEGGVAPGLTVTRKSVTAVSEPSLTTRMICAVPVRLGAGTTVTLVLAGVAADG